jgi:hypothetical protein
LFPLKVLFYSNEIKYHLTKKNMHCFDIKIKSQAIV